MTNSTQLLILGNGFDLHCGLKSSYKDFFESTILDTHTEHFCLKQMRAGISGFWEGLLLEYYKVNEDKDYNWCDIESIIQKTVLRINTSIWKTAFEFTHTNQDPYDCQTIIDPIDKYLFNYSVLFFYNISSLKKNNSEQQKLQLLLNNILQELHNFEKRFCNYLRRNISQEYGEGLNTKYLVNAVNMLAGLTKFTDYIYSDIWEIIDLPANSPKILKKGNKLSDEFTNLKDTYILSFNYTAPFETLFADSPCNYNNVHGKLCNSYCDTCNSSSVIFGIDDSIIHSQTENSTLRIFSKTYRKMVDTSVPTKILPTNSIPLTIKFYGHSLSEADYSYFQSIFDYYNIYGNNNVDLAFYYSKGYEQTDAIYRLINTYGQTLNNQEQGKNLIHKLLLENRLKIQEIN